MRHITVKNRRRLPQLVLAALSATAIVTASSVALVGNALPHSEPNDGAWDPIAFDDCLKKYNPGQAGSEAEMEARIKWCCLDTGGVWKDNGTGTPECVAPPPNSSGSRQIPSNIGTETFTPSPRRPIHVPSDIGTQTFTSTPMPTPFPGG
jgi:hypothetical protein